MISIDMLLSPNYKYPSFCYIGVIELSTHLKLNIREQTLYVLKTKLSSLPGANGIGRQVVPSLLKRGASVAAVKLFTEGLYVELIETNIRVSLVFPGAVEKRDYQELRSQT